MEKGLVAMIPGATKKEMKSFYVKEEVKIKQQGAPKKSYITSI